MTITELKSAARFLTRSPRTAAATVVCIALGTVGALDPVAFAFTAAVLIGGALLASAGPASSAARVPHATVLRGD